MLDSIIFIAFALVMLLLIAFFYFRDKSIYSKLNSYESAIDELHSKIYALEKRATLSNKSQPDFQKALKDLEDRLDGKLNELGEPLLRTIRALRVMEDRVDKFEELIDKKIAQLQNRAITIQQTQATPYEDKIIKLFKDGKSIEEIAKVTRVGVGEVELILKLAKLKK